MLNGLELKNEREDYLSKFTYRVGGISRTLLAFISRCEGPLCLGSSTKIDFFLLPYLLKQVIKKKS